MITKEEFYKLKPKEIGFMEKEPFSEVYPRLKLVLPNFPDCVLEQWPYRHFDQFCENYWWLQFDTFSFHRELWDNKRIMQIGAINIDGLDYWGKDFLENPEFRAKQTWLGKYFSLHKTWPKPIIVLNNHMDAISPYYKQLQRPYHLLEGHMRLAYMRALIKSGDMSVPENHEIWLVECKGVV